MTKKKETLTLGNSCLKTLIVTTFKRTMYWILGKIFNHRKWVRFEKRKIIFMGIYYIVFGKIEDCVSSYKKM